MIQTVVKAALFLAVLSQVDAQARTHSSFGGSNYYFSWRENRGEVDWDGANNICRSLGMSLVSMETPAEANFVRGVVGQERVKFIWTSGRRNGASWIWSGSGRPFTFGQWSRTGGFRRPQPDNREGNEFCMAVLNQFYNDGIVWHDIACHHRKPFICERRAAAARFFG